MSSTRDNIVNDEQVEQLYGPVVLDCTRPDAEMRRASNFIAAILLGALLSTIVGIGLTLLDHAIRGIGPNGIIVLGVAAGGWLPAAYLLNRMFVRAERRLKFTLHKRGLRYWKWGWEFAAIDEIKPGRHGPFYERTKIFDVISYIHPGIRRQKQYFSEGSYTLKSHDGIVTDLMRLTVGFDGAAVRRVLRVIDQQVSSIHVEFAESDQVEDL
ncbi:MAG: hypothetical protein R3C01_00975 [Planctomycetaceae bacterium]